MTALAARIVITVLYALCAVPVTSAAGTFILLTLTLFAEESLEILKVFLNIHIYTPLVFYGVVAFPLSAILIWFVPDPPATSFIVVAVLPVADAILLVLLYPGWADWLYPNFFRHASPAENASSSGAADGSAAGDPKALAVNAAAVAALPDTTLVAVFCAFVESTPPASLCRIEATLALFRLRLVCSRWRHLIETDTVARCALGPCRQIPSLSDWRDSHEGSPTDYPAVAWHEIVDGSLRIPGTAWRKIRRPPKATSRLSNRLSHLGSVHDDDGPCAPRGGWFDLLVDVTFVSWLHAKLGIHLTDDGYGGYYERATLPVLFSNPRRTDAAANVDDEAGTADVAASVHTGEARAEVAKTAEEELAAATTVDRRAFDDATCGAYVPEFPLRVCKVAGADSVDSLVGLGDWTGKLTAEDTALLAWRPAAELCARQCTFCIADEAGCYFNWKESNFNGKGRGGGVGGAEAPVSWFTVTPGGQASSGKPARAPQVSRLLVVVVYGVVAFPLPDPPAPWFVAAALCPVADAVLLPYPGLLADWLFPAIYEAVAKMRRGSPRERVTPVPAYPTALLLPTIL
ncbi:hypothetical protein DFJ73DRAFT_796903 [Zopfochytrium polystomum]|nr:hypothetical protein DFJ73DRAFT_796903 [Zopfochytrium polystomum]